ncbi:MAG TPA: hypothetical protein VEW42_01240 [Candidatus Eisenbacteria bacterium]|nr:hypothetical protein [Candidatus Eisenbacteria bacterium]
MKSKKFFEKFYIYKKDFFRNIFVLSKTILISTILSSTIGVLISFILFLFFIKQIPSSFLDARTLAAITKNLDREYKYKILTTPIKPENSQSIIVWGNDKKFNEYCYNISDKNARKITNKPIIEVFKKNDFNLLSLIPFFKQDYKLYSTFSFSLPKNIEFLNDGHDTTNNDYWISDIRVEDLDGDGSDEIIVRAYSYICEDWGNLYILILKDNGQGFSVESAIPEIAIFKNNEIDEKNLINLTREVKIRTNIGEEKKIVYTSTDNYIGFEDLDNDGSKELIMGFLKIQDDECHLCGHNWYIGVYKYRDGKLLADNNWNHGNLYETTYKISLGDAIGYPDSVINNLFALLGVYYYQCNESICDPFHYLSRKKSSILKLVEKKYGQFNSYYDLENNN